MKIANFDLDGAKTFIIAELSANHNQQLELAYKTIDAMHTAGADAVKLQTYTADTLTLDCRNEYFQPIKQGLWKGKTGYELFQEAYTPWEWQPELKTYIESLGIICFSSPFDHTAIDFLEDIDVPAYKIASFEITDIPLIEYAASKGKPMIMSTGIAHRDDIDEALAACSRMGNEDVALLKCTSAYPSPYNEINLLTIPKYQKVFKCTIGLSDHTLGSAVSIAAVALGAQIVEKHFILDRGMGGPDSAFSMEPDEFKIMVDSIRQVEQALGTATFELTAKAELGRNSRRSLFVVEDIEAGETLTLENVRSIRPGNGLAPKHLTEIIGKRAAVQIDRGTPISWDHIES